eukprot:4816940-Amphidinium_carterae.1
MANVQSAASRINLVASLSALQAIPHQDYRSLALKLELAKHGRPAIAVQCLPVAAIVIFVLWHCCRQACLQHITVKPPTL